MPHLTKKEAVLPRPSDPSSNFDGFWRAPVGSGSAVVSVSQRKVWLDCQLVGEVQIVNPFTCVLVLKYDDVRGKLSEDQQKITWSDGDSWVRPAEASGAGGTVQGMQEEDSLAAKDSMQTDFDGDWEVSSFDTSGAPATVNVAIARHKILWHDGQVTPLKFHGASECSMIMDGETFHGNLCQSGMEIIWSDGDTWRRRHHRTQAHQEHGKEAVQQDEPDQTNTQQGLGQPKGQHQEQRRQQQQHEQQGHQSKHDEEGQVQEQPQEHNQQQQGQQEQGQQEQWQQEQQELHQQELQQQVQQEQGQQQQQGPQQQRQEQERPQEANELEQQLQRQEQQHQLDLQHDLRQQQSEADSPKLDGAEPQAADVAARILGSNACPAGIRQRVPQDWATLERAKDLFISGWGGFDVPTAMAAFLDDEGCAEGSVVPSAGRLRSYGYLLKFFGNTAVWGEQMHRERLRRILETPSAPLAKYVVRHCAFWVDLQNANRLDEVESFFQSQHSSLAAASGDSKQTLEHPAVLLKLIAKERELLKHPFVKFHHLCSLLPVTATADSSMELIMLEDSHDIVRIARELNNCAATYVADVRRKRCSLVLLRKVGTQKCCALGEWDLNERRWSQVSEHSDEPVRAAWQAFYNALSPMLPWPLCSILLQLPAYLATVASSEGQGSDAVAIFHPDALHSLQPLCLAASPWSSNANRVQTLTPVELSAERIAHLSTLHPEAAGALLLVGVASGYDLEVLQILLDAAADAETMSLQGWSPLMLATQREDAQDVGQFLLGRSADVDAHAAGSGLTALMLAAARGDLELMRALVGHKAALDLVARSNGKTALLMSLEHAQVSAAALLVESAAAVNVQRHDGQTALMIASEAGAEELVSSILAARATLNATCNKSRTAVELAASARRWPVVKLLAKAAASLNREEGLETNALTSALHIAAAAKQTEVVQCLANCQACLDREVTPGQTILHSAACNKDWKMVQVLVKLRASVDICSASKSPVVALAAEAGQAGLVEDLAAAGADLQWPLQSAAGAGHLSTVQLLIAQRGNLDGRSAGIALGAAATAKRWPVADHLLRWQADPNASHVAGEAASLTPVMLAAIHSQTKILRALLEQRADLEHRDAEGKTALALATSGRKWSSVRSLIIAGASWRNADERLPQPLLLLASQQREWDVVHQLIRGKASLDVRDDEGRTVLMHAAQGGMIDLVVNLVKAKADVNATCTHGRSVLGRAAVRDQDSTMRFLVSCGARLTEQDAPGVGHDSKRLIERLVRQAR